MKYGKEFQQILEGSSFPPEWKESAIEYRQLKKLIKNVVDELTSMGLSHDVLHKLLVTEDGEAQLPSTDPSTIRDISSPDDEILEFEFESPENRPSETMSNMNEPLEVILDPIPDANNTSASTSSSTRLFAPRPQAHHHKRFRLRLLSDSSTNTQEKSVLDDLPKRPMSVAQFLEAQEKAREEKSPSPSTAENDEKHRGRRVVRRAVTDGHGGVKAEYVLTGNPSNPIPQLRLHLQTSLSPSHSQSSLSPSPSPSAANSTDEDTDLETDEEDEDHEADNRFALSASSTATPRPFDKSKLEDPIIPSSPTLQRMKTALSPIFALASGRNLRDGMGDLTIGAAVVDDSPTTPKAKEFPFPVPASDSVPQSASSQSIDYSNEVPFLSETMPEISTSNLDSDRGAHEREFIIPLSSDLAFFHLLTSALTSLSSFHAKQQDLFKDSVINVCEIISSTISPSSSSSFSSSAPQIIPISMSSSNGITGESSDSPSVPLVTGIHSRKTSKKDLYIWREIFTLWIESEIFESNAERTRGERPLEESEKRLNRFANEVIKRGLGDKRTIKGRKSRSAWEEFLRLNVWLLDLKRFQGANVMAARKILKKHDKRTALTASEGFPSFVRSTLSTHVDKDGNVSTWAFYNTSLPHILLASLTNTLLPILPSLDDYACLICTSIAFKPIRLGCGHLFCVRCLVKMQRAGKDECPLCRSKVVLLADKNSLDMTVMNFMKSWFPKEVKVKQKENELEVAKEQAENAGMDTRCLIM
ncbi:uncharacterized protein IL334_005699 [Kwoniella shivajii]|uniref:RING-14 protein n=1 Tax=Kwoniella shivajii TaxID=564305 RepID=A0ABZ1D5Y5_9TREE|nr:hypothetical protein IL334_005699 [Kwoniella shivajii]